MDVRKYNKMNVILGLMALSFYLTGCNTTVKQPTDGNILVAEDSAQTTTQPPATWPYLTIAFYNVENFFDTIDHPDTKDEEYTPEGFRQWGTKRFFQKIDNIARVADSLEPDPQMQMPALMGFCEVENKSVMEQLLKHKSFSQLPYAVAHLESPDFRGIDNALIYRTDIFTPQQIKNIPITFTDDNYTTRDILLVQGLLNNGSHLSIFVNHWPSRRGGQTKSEPRRLRAATVLKKAVDQVTSQNPKSNIIIMGDFNDYPYNKSITEVLQAHKPDSSQSPLINLTAAKTINNGTHKYDGHWGVLDQIIVSDNLLNNQNKLYVDGGRVYIYKARWLLADDYFGPGLAPFRTYGGRKYLGGYSDHLPVYFRLVPQN